LLVLASGVEIGIPIAGSCATTQMVIDVSFIRPISSIWKFPFGSAPAADGDAALRCGCISRFQASPVHLLDVPGEAGMTDARTARTLRMPYNQAAKLPAYSTHCGSAPPDLEPNAQREKAKVGGLALSLSFAARIIQDSESGSSRTKAIKRQEELGIRILVVDGIPVSSSRLRTPMSL